MQANRMVGIDLPLKALVWQDASGKTWLTFLQPAALVLRHDLSGETAQIIGRMTALLEAVVARVVNP